VATSQQGEYQNPDRYRKFGSAAVKQLCRFGSATSMSNIYQTITHFEKMREVFVIWYVMNKNLLHFSKIPSQLFIIQVLS
jgi:hypothetical protein